MKQSYPSVIDFFHRGYLIINVPKAALETQGNNQFNSTDSDLTLPVTKPIAWRRKHIPG